MKSSIQRGANVQFADFTSERVYMHGFYQRDGLPKHLAQHQQTVDQMLGDLKTDGLIHLMVDQSIVQAGQPQRRPGVHIDGYWVPALQGHRIDENPAGHKFPQRVPDTNRHNTQPPARHSVGRHGTHCLRLGHNTHRTRLDPTVEVVILAASVQGARAYTGYFDSPCGKGGDYSHLNLSKLDSVDLTAGTAWAGNALTFLHESVGVKQTGPRTLIRLNVPGVTIH